MELREEKISTFSAAGFDGETAKDVSNRSAVDTGEKTLVQQQFKDEVDINTIMRRFAGGIIPQFGRQQAMYGDFTGILNYEDAVAKVAEADAKFMTLPPDVRMKFDNSPAKLLEAVHSMPEDEFNEMLKVADVVSPPPAVGQ